MRMIRAGARWQAADQTDGWRMDSNARCEVTRRCPSHFAAGVRRDKRRIFCRWRRGGRVEKVEIAVSRHFCCSLTLCSSRQPSNGARKTTPPSPLSSPLAHFSAGQRLNPVRLVTTAPGQPASQRPADPWAPHVSPWLSSPRLLPLWVKVPRVRPPLLVIPFVCLRGCHCDLCRTALICHRCFVFFFFLPAIRVNGQKSVGGGGVMLGRLTFNLWQKRRSFVCVDLKQPSLWALGGFLSLFFLNKLNSPPKTATSFFSPHSSSQTVANNSFPEDHGRKSFHGWDVPWCWRTKKNV